MVRTRSALRGYPRRGPRRAVEWTDVILNNSLTSAQQLGIDLSTNFLSTERKGSTIVRTIVDLTLAPLSASVTLRIAWGLVMMELDAFNAAIFPDPFVADDQPGWMLRGERNLRTSNVDDVPNNAQLQIDLKAKRKFMGEDELYVLVLERGAETGTIVVSGMIRILWMHR